MSQYPGYRAWLVVLSQNDVGLLFVGMVVLTVVAWLVLARFGYPRLLPALRIGLVILFYVTCAFFLLKG